MPDSQGAEVGYAQIDSAGHESLKGTITQIKDTVKQRLSQTADAASRVVDKTATETATENRDKQARLVVWSEELKDALETILMFFGEMSGLGKDAGGEITLNTAWSRAEAEAEKLAGQMPPANNEPPMGAGMVN